ncbi:TPA: hypothetical protein DCZ46_03640 [Candidatus Campbellbacteria bacterium]|uniref:Uncharacterized protein n=2 Tax=Candidatus Campbelliibacteriota TaxID=1752727 RepID=A0A1F5EMC1_9BACT|nr:MAG: protein of unknown function with transmembrane region [Candidatus Campbellbacteria bacterium GW2011_OD1_34_28]KKP74776.1 MAG: hypothetical protein UR74_C0002G0042 [Candidatus Campbellbacteria bacterium GW2011_GWD2_35_24]KKP75662.1 MAG: hypothetical protein UR75_C0002G0043 [Candidatus Campbellbacteria bacterium GW2011_GWC2_35_28]KKP77090.1 MAG: hypothetical protein UR76_C0002G0291 [Candidatus Campbellbacteria bacterium GW2011_GWC1_35_31]KKP79016.1 MAG: hypothetical protein UR79_C0002G029
MNGKIISFSVLALAFIVGGVGVTSAYNNVGRGQAVQDLTDEQKTVLDQMHDLRMSGDFEGADALREQAGLPQMGMGKGFNRGGAMQAHREESRTAVENNDYTAFQTAVAGSPMEDKVTPEIFAKMVEAHALREAGDLDGAREIMQGLGIGKGEGVRMGGERQGRGYGEGNWNK